MERKTRTRVRTKYYDAQRYVRLLEDHLEAFGDAKHPNGFRFQRDNAKSHTAKITDQYFYGGWGECFELAVEESRLESHREPMGHRLCTTFYSNFRQFDYEETCARR